MANQLPIPPASLACNPAAPSCAPAIQAGCPILAKAFRRKGGRPQIHSSGAFIGSSQTRRLQVTSQDERRPIAPILLRAPFLRFFSIARAGNLDPQPALFIGSDESIIDSDQMPNCHPEGDKRPVILSDRSAAKGVEGPAFVLRNAAAPLFVALLCLSIVGAITAIAQAAPPASPVVLDRVVAVVNNQAILASDIDNEIRLSVLDPGRGGLGVLTRTRALDQLIGRALIQQQIRQEDLQSADPTEADIEARLTEIRKEVPACVRENCASDAGWKAFLSAQGLTQERVETYLSSRVEILRFIEQRFSQGISIEPKDIETYYHDTLLPQYAKGEAVPPLDQVSKRIQEILLQQHVNAMFDDWLNNLRKQGDIEVLDPALEPPATESPAPNSGTASVEPTPPSGNSKKRSQ